MWLHWQCFVGEVIAHVLLGSHCPLAGLFLTGGAFHGRFWCSCWFKLVMYKTLVDDHALSEFVNTELLEHNLLLSLLTVDPLLQWCCLGNRLISPWGVVILYILVSWPTLMCIICYLVPPCPNTRILFLEIKQSYPVLQHISWCVTNSTNIKVGLDLYHL